ncbi:hypothetical protein KCV04_g22686, partial [Aureobasidium melanogenum]
CFMVGVTEWGLKKCAKVQEDYNEESWTPLKAHFKRPQKAVGEIKNGDDSEQGAIGSTKQVPHWT